MFMVQKMLYPFLSLLSLYLYVYLNVCSVLEQNHVGNTFKPYARDRERDGVDEHSSSFIAIIRSLAVLIKPRRKVVYF